MDQAASADQTANAHLAAKETVKDAQTANASQFASAPKAAKVTAEIAQNVDPTANAVQVANAIIKR